MKIYVGADHAGYELKEKLKNYLYKKHTIVDMGNLKYNKKDDYPKFAAKVGWAVSKSRNFGILICGSGHGVCIAANKIKDVRAALCENTRDAKLARHDDDANILCLQGRYINYEDAKKISNTFLKTKFSQAKRYQRRVNQIKRLI